MNTVLRTDQTRGKPIARAPDYEDASSLPAYYYVSAESYARDISRMRELTWFIAGHESQISKPGDYKLFNLAHESIILVRDKMGAVNAFFNVCRHRGSHICKESRGHVNLLVCPYHAWAYRLDGTLLPPRSMPQGFDPTQYGLKTCHVRVAEGVIFVCLAIGSAPDFEEFIAPLRPFLAPYALSRTKVVAEERVISESNWKVGAENIVECYHCVTAHRDLLRIHELTPPSVETVDARGETWSSRMRRSGRRSEPLADDSNSRHLQSAFPMEIGRGHVTGSMDGRPVSKLLGDMDEWSGGWTLLVFNPFCHAMMYDDYVQLITYMPTDVTQTEATMIWLVREDAVEGVDYHVPALTRLMSLVMHEDVEITDTNQRGIASSSYSPTPLSMEEARVIEFHRWYIKNFVDSAALDA